MEDMLKVGIITTTHGLQGEVKVFPTTDDRNRFHFLKEVYLDTGITCLKLTVERVKFFKNIVIIKFRNMDHINDMEKYKGKSLYVTRENAVPLKKDEYYIADLIGCKVVNEDQTFTGTLTDVFSTGANDVYEIRTQDGKEILLPAIKECIRQVDIENKIIDIHLLEGLLT